MPHFIGLDLAWTPHHETGIRVLEGNERSVRLIQLDCRIDTPDRFARYCRDFGGDVVAAIDAPLLVGPERTADRELSAVFGRYRAGAYSANVSFLERMNGLAGPKLAQSLRASGFVLEPSLLTRQVRGRFALEVFPHSAHVVLFDLPERLAYKKGRLARRRDGLRLYQRYLGVLLGSEMPEVSATSETMALLAADSVAVPGLQLKRLEDQLDAVTCAYVAYHCWNLGPERFRVFGCDEHGAIVTPWPLRPARTTTSAPEQTSP